MFLEDPKTAGSTEPTVFGTSFGSKSLITSILSLDWSWQICRWKRWWFVTCVTPKQSQTNTVLIDTGKYWECRQPTFWNNPFCSKKTARFGVHGLIMNCNSTKNFQVGLHKIKKKRPTAVELHFQSPKWHHLQSDQWQSAKPPSPVWKMALQKCLCLWGLVHATPPEN